MLVKVSHHLEKLTKKSVAIKKQFFPSPKENQYSKKASDDPLREEKHQKVKGLYHKYPRRVLIELTRQCPAHCRFCTRRRKIGQTEESSLSERDLLKMIDYVQSRPEINEVIFSGGEPLLVPELLTAALKKFSRLKQIKVLRIHTRAPVSQPRLVSQKILRFFARIKKQPLYLCLHFNHPDELTRQTIRVVKALRKAGVILLSQTVFLKGVNDSYQVLAGLFTRLIELGVKPYYLFHCDLVRGVEHFIVPLKKEIEIATKLRKNLSGLAFPLHGVDAPSGFDKIP